MLLGIPGCRVGSAGLEGKLLLGEADTSTTASIGAGGSLASNTLIVGEAGTLSGASIADTHIGALHDRVNIVRVGDISDPSVVLGACAAGAISVSPGGLAIFSVVAVASVGDVARPASTAAVGASGVGDGDKRKHSDKH